MYLSFGTFVFIRLAFNIFLFLLVRMLIFALIHDGIVSYQKAGFDASLDGNVEVLVI